MKLILNNSQGSPTFIEALHELADGARTLSVAVSYIQRSGWSLFHREIAGLNSDEMRIVCTDQFGITQPTAVRAAIDHGIQVRNFSGNRVYHPKIFIAHDDQLNPMRYLVGSANLSSVALTSSIEGGFLGSNPEHLALLGQWFNELFDSTQEFTPETLQQMSEKWSRAATERARYRFRTRRDALPIAPAAVISEDLDALEDIFATLLTPVGLLCFDYAGNNVRNIAQARLVLQDLTQANDKQRSETKLLGFTHDGALTEMGQLARNAPSEMDFAQIWCRWIQTTPEAILHEVNPRLLRAKQVFPQFWRLQPEVIDYFLNNAHDPETTTRRILQTVELLCNVQAVVENLSLEDIRAVSELLVDPESLPLEVRGHIFEYFDNKGTRSWGTEDRRTLPIAWQNARAV